MLKGNRPRKLKPDYGVPRLWGKKTAKQVLEALQKDCPQCAKKLARQRNKRLA